jgi:two-component system LytT family response regulator
MTAPAALRVLVVDDEPIARRRLTRMLRESATIGLVGECSGGRAAVEHIRAMAPDLVFLDIQMPDLDGFGVIEEVGVEHMPTIVFVTAFDQFALRAFDVHAVDYVLKPFDRERFTRALGRALERVRARTSTSGTEDERLRALVHEILAQRLAELPPPPPQYVDRLAVKVQGTLRVLPLADVDWFETDGNYVRAHAGKGNYLIRNTANRLQETLDPGQFARIHRRYLVNLSRVVAVEPWFGGDAIVVLRDGKKLRLSRNYRADFHARLLTDHSEAG